MKKILFMASMMLMGVALNVNAQSETGDCGTLIIPIEYDDIDAGNDGLFVVTKGNKKGVVDAKGKTIVPIEYDDIELGKEGENCGGLIVVSNKMDSNSENGGDKICGLYNKNGVMVAPLKYLNIRIRDRYGFEGLAQVTILKGVEKAVEDEIGTNKSHVYEIRSTEHGVLFKDGTLLTSYDNMSISEGGLIEVRKNGKYGVLNKNGEIVVPIKYDLVHIKGNKNLIKVITPYQEGRKCGVYNSKGQVIVPIGKYESVDVRESYIKVEQNGQKGILSSNGNEIVPVGKYGDVSVYECSDREQYYVEIKTNNKKGAVNDNGKVFIPIGKYEGFRVLNKKLAFVILNGKKGVVDRNGTLIVPFGKYDNLAYDYGVLTYSKNGKWGILGENGNQATPAEYDAFKPARHSHGMALVAKDGKAGVIDCKGNIIIPLDNYTGGSILERVGFLIKDGETIFFNTKGEILAPLGKYEKCVEKYGKLTGYQINNWPVPLNPTTETEGLFIVTSNEKKGVVKLW